MFGRLWAFLESSFLKNECISSTMVLSWQLYPMHGVWCLSTLAGRNTKYSQPDGTSGNCSAWCFTVILFPASGSFLSCMHRSNTPKTQGNTSADLWSFLPAVFSSLALSSMITSCTGLPQFRSLTFQFRSPSLRGVAWKRLLAISWGDWRDHLVYFSSLCDNSPVLPCCPVWKQLSHVFYQGF